MPLDSDGRLLAVVRHAKAEQEGRTDFDRALADRGRRDAADAGSWLAGEGFEPDHALVSAALRTRQTWEAIAEGAGWDLDPDLDRGLYDASPDTVLDLVRLVDDDVRRLLVVGHNPTMATLANLLEDGEGDPDLVDRMMSEFPTSTVAVFEYDGSWADIAPGTASLVGFHVGRG